MRVLQFNLWNTNEPLESRMRTLEKGIRHLDPDVITFQEVSPVMGRPQISPLAERLDYYLYYADAGAFHGRREGNAILSKVPASRVETMNLNCADVDLQRVAICCFFEEPLDRLVGVLSTHLAYPLEADEARRIQAEEVADFIISTGASGAFVLGADLNAEPRSSAVAALLNIDGARDAWEWTNSNEPRVTFAAENPFVEPRLGPNRRIDYLIVGGSLIVERCEVVFTERRLGIASDHYGILAEILPRL